MRIVLLHIIIPLLLISNSCLSQSTNVSKYCGSELAANEYAEVQKRISLQPRPYEADTLSNVYDQINDSIRKSIPDSLEFEVFLVLLNSEEIGIVVAGLTNPSLMEKVSCIVLDGSFGGVMPKQRYLFFNKYDFPDGSGEDTLVLALKSLPDHGKGE